ncbi:hypothetical protein TSUD_298200 [Trifolium subterraneum]|nr:hypothetical protein TSUD_298200 [Trifolium subterraneum]
MGRMVFVSEDFPLSEKGICPDLIMNPHGYPRSRSLSAMASKLTNKTPPKKICGCNKFIKNYIPNTDWKKIQKSIKEEAARAKARSKARLRRRRRKDRRRRKKEQ